MEDKLSELTLKYDTAERKHKDVVEQATDKGISVTSTAGVIAKQK